MATKVIDTEKNLIQALKGLLNIAKIAMPDTYYHSDSRVKQARKELRRLEAHRRLHG